MNIVSAPKTQDKKSQWHKPLAGERHHYSEIFWNSGLQQDSLLKK
ncbi:hypothetical protein FORC066_3829 [Yersinia enterocolitica]|nr:hypothetical protein FORC066_3829 [Yersinia enterocolitica]